MEKVKKTLYKITKLLNEDGIPYSVIGGNAVAAWVAAIDENLATKHDVELLRRDIKEMEGRVKAGIIIWVAGMLVAQTAIVATLVKRL